VARIAFRCIFFVEQKSQLMKKHISFMVATMLMIGTTWFPCAGQQAPLSVQLKRIEGQGNMARVLDFVTGTHDEVLASPEHRIAFPTYDFNKGPIRVEVLDTALLPNAEMIIAFDGVADSSGWKMYAIGGMDTIYSESTIAVGSEQLIPQWGLLVQVRQTGYLNLDTCNFMLDASIAFSGQLWLKWVVDTDANDYTNWIRSGPYLEGIGLLDYGDSYECFEQVNGGTWAPYRLVSHDSGYASPTWNKFKGLTYLNHLASVDIVITPDQTKWTRCAVLEIGDSLPMNIGGARRFDLRQSPSVNKLGQPAGSGTMGMSWFPGYAINLETGERLNMAFGENSNYPQHGGADMIWNPSNAATDAQGGPVMGGGHYIYVFGHNGSNTVNDMPLYDEGAFTHSRLASNTYVPTDAEKRKVFKDAMWVAVPLLEDGHTLLENELLIRLRIRKPFKPYQASSFVVNDAMPMYSFSTANISTALSDAQPSRPEVTVWPIPALDVVHVRINAGHIQSLHLYDIQGRTVLTQAINDSQDQLQVNTSGLPSGTYFLVVQGEEGHGVSKMIVR